MKRIRLATFVFTFALISCSQNLLQEMGSKNTDPALLESAKRNISDADFESAITNCSGMSAGYLAKREPAYICASAYAGACGLNMISFLASLETFDGGPANGGTDILLQFFLTLTGIVDSTHVDACNSAQDLLESIGAAADRTTDENTLMTLVTLKKLDILANATADADGDNAVDGAYASCSLSAANAASYAGALWELKESAPSSGFSFGSDLATVVQATCTALAGVNAALDYCAAADPDTFTAEQLDGARTVVNEGSAFGLGDCNVGGETVPECECNP